MTYMSPYHRTASGPRWTRTGSNCGWTSKEKSPGRARERPIIPEDGGGEASEVAQVVAFRGHRRQFAAALGADHHADEAGHDEGDGEAGGHREHAEQHAVHGDTGDEAGHAEGEQHEADHEGSGFHGGALPISIDREVGPLRGHRVP